MKKRLLTRALPACFLLIVLTLTVLFFALPKQDFAENEKRLLSKKPAFSFAALLDGMKYSGKGI